MSQKLRVGIIGCGVIAPVHAESYDLIDGVEIAWTCDLVEEKARRLAEKHKAPNVTTDYAEVLADRGVDCISVCTDHGSHSPITVAALEAGKHVLCEKALAADSEGLEAMFTAHAKRPELVFGGVFQHRFDRDIQLLKRLVDEQALGDLLTAGTQVRCQRTPDYYRADRWRGTWAEEGGAVLINQAIHFIDALLWITGGAKAVSGAFANLTHGDSMEAEDTAVAVLRMTSGALGTIEATCSSHIGWEPTISLHGSQGSVELRAGQGLKVCFADQDLCRRVEQELAECYNEKRVALGRRHYGTTHPEQIADFVAAVRGGGRPFVTAASARHAVEVVLGIYRSHQDGGWVEVA
ncbi:MAG: Gfo/Idh/MocA family oxidoreductase [Anaerolineaceae bacterium]|nr:Gfo/Idh/MocA family oxidoreductase [Anaerolineaceae bacterium]